MPRIRTAEEQLERIAQGDRAQRDQVLRLFTNRDPIIQAFKDILNTAYGEPIPVMAIHGVAGSGKTWLITYVIETICKPNEIPYARLDFREEMYRAANDALFRLRGDIHSRHGYRFGRFDSVWSQYMLQTQGYSTRRGRWLPDELGPAADLIDAAELIPFAGEVAKGIKLVELLGRRAFDWFRSRFGDDWGRVLQRMEPARLVDVMPIAFAEDLNDNLRERATRFVLFLDSFEQIQGPPAGFVRQMAGSLDYVLMVILGRNPLQWHKMEPAWAEQSNLRQFPVGAFSYEHAKEYLAKFSITDEALLAHLFEITKGHVQYLALAAELTTTLRQKGEQVTKSRLRVRASQDLLPQLLSELSSDEKRAVQLAAIPRWFSEEILGRLSDSPETAGSWVASLVGHSLVEPRDKIEDAYRLHAVIRDLVLASLQGKLFYRERQEELVQYFAAKAEEAQGEERLAYVVEQLHHQFSIDERAGYQQFRDLYEQALRLRRLRECRALLQSLPEDPQDYRDKGVGLWVQKWHADLLRIEYRNEEAHSLYERLLSDAEGDEALRAHVLRGLGSVSRRLGARKQGETYWQLALRAARASGDRLVEADLLRRMGDIHRIRGQEREAERVLRAALEIARAEDDEATLALVSNMLGRVAAKFGRWQDARRHYAEAAANWENLGAAVRQTAPWQNWGVLEIRLGNLAAAGERFQAHLVYGWEEKLWGQVETALNNLGAVAYDYGDLDAALHYRTQRLSIRRARGGKTAEAFAMRGVAVCLIRLGAWDEAWRLLQKALDIYREEYPESSRLSGVNRNLARLYILQGQLDKAARHASEALRVAVRTGSVVMRMRSVAEIGSVLHATGQHEKALRRFRRALETAHRLEARLLEKDLLIDMGLSSLSLNDWESGEAYLERGLKLAKELHTRYEEVKATIGLATLYYHMGDRVRAYNSLKRAEVRATAQSAVKAISVWDDGPLRDIEERDINGTAYHDWLAKIACLGATWSLHEMIPEEAAERYLEALSHGYRFNAISGRLIVQDLRQLYQGLAIYHQPNYRRFFEQMSTKLDDPARPPLPRPVEDKIRQWSARVT